jgi:hypothetical protein
MRAAGLTGEWNVHGVRVHVSAATPELLTAAHRELPVRPTGEVEAAPSVRIRLGGVCPAPPAPLEAGAGGMEFLLRYPRLWARQPSGARFYADLHSGEAIVEPGGWDTVSGEVSSGVSLLLSYLLRERALWPVHASGVYAGDASVLLVGPSGSGKSTTAALLVQAGYPLLADDLVLLRNETDGLRVLPYPAPVRLCGPALEWLSHQGEGAGFASDYRNRPAARPGLLLFPEVCGGRSRADALPAGEALRRLIESSLLLGGREVTARHAGALAALARSAACFRLRLGPEPESSPALIGSLLG